MTLIDTPSSPDSATDLPVPSRSRRAVLVLVGLLNCALPTVFTLNITRMLVTGELSEHRYHQLTGQGEVLFALWLVPIVLMLRAGWRGRRPAPALGLHHLTLIGCGVAAAVVAPGGGAPFLVAVITVTGALLWAALPVRPRLRLRIRVDPLLTPLALVGSALLVPYAVDQLALQDAATTGFHASNPHFFDQAWIALTLAVLALLAAVLPAAQPAVRWVALGLVVVGGAGLALGESAPVHLGLLVLGAVTVLADLVGRRSPSRN